MHIRSIIFALLVLGAFAAQHAAAHSAPDDDGSPAGPRNWHELWRTWGWEPLSIISLALSAALYIIGLRRIWGASRVGGGVRRWEALCFGIGWISLFIALVSPLHPWGQVLMSAHMTQHEILMLVSAPLLVLGRPLVVFLSALPVKTATALARASNAPAWRRTWHAICHPLSAWLIHAIALWAWHIPALFDATLRSELVHFLQHASFLGTALLFWWAVMTSRSAAMSYGLALLYVFTTALHNQVLAGLMTFSRTVWYPTYLETTQSWGLSPLQDQQLGGLIMWIPAGLVYIIAAIALVAGMMRESERRVLRHERFARGAAIPVLACLLLCSCEPEQEQPITMTAAHPQLGREKIGFHGCASCHTIPGIPGADGLVGPSLERIGSRAYIGGVIENTPQNLVRWIQDPPSIDPQTAMPNLRVSEEDARAIASYLYTLR